LDLEVTEALAWRWDLQSIIAQRSSKALKCQVITSHRDERLPMTPTLEEAVSKLSKPQFSSNKLDHGRNPCRVCDRSSLKQLKSAKDKIIRQKKTISNKDVGPQDEWHNQLSPFCVVNAQAKGLPEVEEKAFESVVTLTSIENPIGQQKRIQVLKPYPSIVSSSSCWKMEIVTFLLFSHFLSNLMICWSVMFGKCG